jgi:hypothetical protein
VQSQPHKERRLGKEENEKIRWVAGAGTSPRCRGLHPTPGGNVRTQISRLPRRPRSCRAKGGCWPAKTQPSPGGVASRETCSRPHTRPLWLMGPEKGSPGPHNEGGGRGAVAGRRDRSGAYEQDRSKCEAQATQRAQTEGFEQGYLPQEVDQEAQTAPSVCRAWKGSPCKACAAATRSCRGAAEETKREGGSTVDKLAKRLGPRRSLARESNSAVNGHGPGSWILDARSSQGTGVGVGWRARLDGRFCGRLRT